MDARMASFSAEASSAFRFLVDRYGFEGPDTSKPPYVGYTRTPWRIWIVRDEYNRTVDTYVWHTSDGVERRAPLHVILTRMGLPAQRAATSAQTRKGMVRSLTRQAEALTAVLPVLLGPGGSNLIDD
jgi:hypothetical protein